MSRRDPRGRLKTSGRFAVLPLTVLKDPSVTTLPLAARWVLVAMAGQFSGGNNGALCLTRSVAREYGVRSVDTLHKALVMLCERRLLDLTHQGSRVPATPACYAITWRPLNRTEWTAATIAASHAYREKADWQRATKPPARPCRMKAKSDVRPPDTTRPPAGPANAPEGAGSPSMSPPSGPISAPARVRPPDTSRVLPLRDAVKTAA